MLGLNENFPLGHGKSNRRWYEKAAKLTLSMILYRLIFINVHKNLRWKFTKGCREKKNSIIIMKICLFYSSWSLAYSFFLAQNEVWSRRERRMPLKIHFFYSKMFICLLRWCRQIFGMDKIWILFQNWFNQA